MAEKRRTLIVVFGAAVRADGSASPTLARRVGYAAAAAELAPDSDLFCSGGVGRYPPSEARVMADMLAVAVPPERIVLDEDSADTVQTVRAAALHARRHGYARVLTCTDSYHQPRVRMLFALFGLRSRPVRLPRRGSRRQQWRMQLREAAALPYDLVAGGTAALRSRRQRSS